MLHIIMLLGSIIGFLVSITIGVVTKIVENPLMGGESLFFPLCAVLAIAFSEACAILMKHSPIRWTRLFLWGFLGGALYIPSFFLTTFGIIHNLTVLDLTVLHLTILYNVPNTVSYPFAFFLPALLSRAFIHLLISKIERK